MSYRSILVLALFIGTGGVFGNEGDEFSKLTERWRSVAKELQVTGYSVAIVEGDRLVFTDVYGTRAPEDGTPITSTTPFYIASSTKPFTAMGIMVLADEGKLKIDDPVIRHLPRFKLPDPELTQKITLRDLMCHRYGINSSLIVWADAYTGQITEEKFYRFLESAQIKGSYEYTNLHFTILGRVIEAVSGMPWQEFLEERIFRPAGMKHTTALASRLYGEFEGALPVAYTAAGRVLSPNPKADNVMHAAGGMGSSAEDLARWVILNMNGGSIEGRRIVSEESMSEMLKMQLEVPEEERPGEAPAMGLGWMLNEYNGEKTVHHHGGYIGAAARILFFPEKRRGIAVLNNDTGPGSAITDVIMSDFCDAVTGKQREDGLPKLFENAKAWRERRAQQPELTPSENHRINLSKPIEAYAGVYESPIHGTMTIALEGDRLAAEVGNLKLALQNEITDRFNTDVFGDREMLRFQFDNAGNVKTAVLGPKVGTVRRFERK